MQSNFAVVDEFACVQSIAFNNKGGGRAVLRWAKMMERIAKTRVTGRTLGMHSLTRRYFNHQGISAKTLFGRYSKVTVGSNQPKEDAIELLDAFSSKFCRDFTNHASRLQPITDPVIDAVLSRSSPRTRGMVSYMQHSCSDDDYTYHLAEYAKALQQKHIPREQQDHLLDRFSFIVKYFSKRQCKPDIRHSFDIRDKDGQGVSAWSKELNFLFSSYARQASQRLQSILLPNVFYNSNKADAEIGHDVSQYINEAIDQGLTLENFANDFTEYDSSMWEVSPIINSVFLSAFGCNDRLLNIYRQMRTKWVISDDCMKLYGNQKMHSGEPLTLFGNTLFNMMATALIVEFNILVVAVFKGDDSLVIGTNIKPNPKSLNWCSSRGLQLKIENPPFAEFAGFIVTPYGYFPDVIRKATKFLSNIYYNPAHFREAIINLDADLACITSHAALNHGCHALAEYYNWTNKTSAINPIQVYQLCSFLHAGARRPYEHLYKFDKECYYHGASLKGDL